MTRLPKKYFKSITDYVMTYYTADGVSKYADKLYNAVKTVTKDFTRTDPVYVRIGEDGEPEIHYTMTQANARSYFANMDLGNATIYVHNGAVLTSCSNMFSSATMRAVYFDSIGQATAINGMFFGKNYNDCTLKTIGLFDTSKATEIWQMFQGRNAVTSLPAFDFSGVLVADSAFNNLFALTELHAYGMKASFDLVQTALKHDAILEVFNNLGSGVAEGTTLTLGANKLALMSDEEKKIATDKGWTLA